MFCLNSFKRHITAHLYSLSFQNAFTTEKLIVKVLKQSTYRHLTLPYSAGVVLGARDDGVTVVVEGTTEDFIRVALQDLQTVARLGLPDARSLVRGGSEDAGSLGIEGHLGDLAFVSGEDGVARAGHGVVNTRVTVRRRGHQLRTCAKKEETSIQCQQTVA